MVSARAEGRGVCQDKKVQLYLKCCCLKKKKNHIHYLYCECFSKTIVTAFPLWVETDPWAIRLTWLQGQVCCYPLCACSFSFCVHMCECVRMRRSCPNLSRLLALMYLDMLLCTPTPWCYISSGSKCLQITLSYRCRHSVFLCSYFQLALNELWLKCWGERWWRDSFCHLANAKNILQSEQILFATLQIP